MRPPELLDSPFSGAGQLEGDVHAGEGVLAAAVGVEGDAAGGCVLRIKVVWMSLRGGGVLLGGAQVQLPTSSTYARYICTKRMHAPASEMTATSFFPLLKSCFSRMLMSARLQ